MLIASAHDEFELGAAHVADSAEKRGDEAGTYR